MALTANQEIDRLVDQELRQYGLTASAHVFKGGPIGIADEEPEKGNNCQKSRPGVPR